MKAGNRVLGELLAREAAKVGADLATESDLGQGQVMLLDQRLLLLSHIVDGRR
jgi:hypothetical protein